MNARRHHRCIEGLGETPGTKHHCHCATPTLAPRHPQAIELYDAPASPPANSMACLRLSGISMCALIMVSRRVGLKQNTKMAEAAKRVSSSTRSTTFFLSQGSSAVAKKHVVGSAAK